MTHKWLYSFLILWLYSINTHAAHAYEGDDHDHESVICEVCTLAKTLDDVIPSGITPFSIQLQQTNQINPLWINAFVDVNHDNADPIRGPPHQA